MSACPPASERTTMLDLIWIAVILGLLAMTLAYVSLCERA